MGRSANIPICIVENEILDMDKLAGDPHAGNQLGEMCPFRVALPNRATPDNLIEACEPILSPRNGWEPPLSGYSLICVLLTI
ncbi:hypothetical protein FHX05_005254 [Rhizobium sp. BK491]|nr:hypothetical protein [Rhizobium sp. BK491]